MDETKERKRLPNKTNWLCKQIHRNVASKSKATNSCRKLFQIRKFIDTKSERVTTCSTLKKY